jgi:hypothetical protein
MKKKKTVVLTHRNAPPTATPPGTGKGCKDKTARNSLLSLTKAIIDQYIFQLA